MFRFIFLALVLLASGLQANDSLVQAAVTSTDKGMQTAFGSLRVQTPHYIFEFKRNYGTTQLFFQNVTFGAGAAATHTTNGASTTLTAGTTASGYALMQTRNYFEYQPAVGWRGFMSGNFMGAVTGTVKRYGLFDDQNGVFFEVSGTAASLAVGIRSNFTGTPTDTKVVQANWNLDRLDGTGPSKKTLDITKANLMFFEQAWLGVGSVWYGWVIDGVPIYCHVVNNENRYVGVYDSTASLPFRAEVRNWGTGPGATPYMSSIGWSLQAEGPYDPSGRVMSQASQATTGTITSGTLRVLMSLRLRSPWKRGLLKPIDYWNTQSTANTNGKLEVWLLQGGAGMGTAQNSLTWTACSNGRSATEYTSDTYTLTTTTAGVVCIGTAGSVGAQRGGSGAFSDEFINAGSDYDGNQDVVALTYTPVDGNAVCPTYGITWKERY